MDSQHFRETTEAELQAQTDEVAAAVALRAEAIQRAALELVTEDFGGVTGDALQTAASAVLPAGPNR